MNEIVTKDWGKFGYREIEEAKELLSHIKEIDSYSKIEDKLIKLKSNMDDLGIDFIDSPQDKNAHRGNKRR